MSDEVQNICVKFYTISTFIQLTVGDFILQNQASLRWVIPYYRTDPVYGVNRASLRWVIPY